MKTIESLKQSSYFFAKIISENVAFLVGGPDGLSKEVLNRANNIWSLSQLTLAHSMARLVILEQFYRVFSILRGTPYHRSGSNFGQGVDT